MAALEGPDELWILNAMTSKAAKSIPFRNSSTSQFLLFPSSTPRCSSSLPIYNQITPRPHISFISSSLHHVDRAGAALPLFSYPFPPHLLELRSVGLLSLDRKVPLSLSLSLVLFLFCSLFPVSLMRPVDKHHHLDRPFNFYSHDRDEKGDPLKPPKGWMGIRVGMEGEEDKQRFVVPVEYLKHPLFVGLLKEAEREYGFDHPGAITIPCHIERFRHVRGIIDLEHGAALEAHRQRYHRGHHRLAHFSRCFWA